MKVRSGGFEGLVKLFPAILDLVIWYSPGVSNQLVNLVDNWSASEEKCAINLS